VIAAATTAKTAATAESRAAKAMQPPRNVDRRTARNPLRKI
jgi:hypothetical protein